MITPTTYPPLNTHLLTTLCMNLEEEHFRSIPMPGNYPRKRHLSNYVNCSLNWLIFSQNTILLKRKRFVDKLYFFFRLGMWHFIKSELSETVTSSKILIVINNQAGGFKWILEKFYRHGEPDSFFIHTAFRCLR